MSFQTAPEAGKNKVYIYPNVTATYRLVNELLIAYGGIEAYTGEPDNYRLLLTDLDNTELSVDFVSVLNSIEDLELTSTDIEKARSLINEGKIAGALILHSGFMDSLIIGNIAFLELLYDKEQNFEAGMLQSIIINSLYSFSRDVEAQKRIFSGLQAYNSYGTDSTVYRNGVITNKGPVIKMTSIVGENNDFNLGLIQAVAGTSILMLLFSVAGIGTSILEEKENGTISRLLFSPLMLKTILYSKMLFAYLISVLQLSVMFLFAWVFLKLDLTINPWALVLMILSTSFAVSSLGIFLAAIAKSRQQALSLSTLIILVMSAIGGSMIPLFIMPDIMSKLAVISVNYWSIQGFYDIFWRSLPLSEILPKILLLIGVGLTFTLLSLRLFSKNIIKII